MQNLQSQSNMDIPRRTTFSKFPNGALPIHPLANLWPSQKPLPTDGALPFRARNVFGQKSSCSSPHIASCHYFLWENFSAIGDKPAWRLITNQITTLRADGLRKSWGFWVGTWNVDSLTGRAGEVVEALSDKKVEEACIQETIWKGSGCKFYRAKGKKL